MKKKGRCAKCGTCRISVITRHHILPRVHFHGRGGIVYLCRSCHNEIEDCYQLAEKLFGHKVDYDSRKKLTAWQYEELTVKFLEQ